METEKKNGKKAHRAIVTDRLFISRKLTVSGSVFLFDHDTGSADETLLVAIPTKTIFLTDDSIQEILNFSACVDDEVRAELHADVQLISNGDIRINTL